MTHIFVRCIQRMCVFVFEYLPGYQVFETQQFVPVLLVLLGVLLSEESLYIYLKKKKKGVFIFQFQLNKHNNFI